MKKIIFTLIIISAILGELTRIYLKWAVAVSFLDFISFISFIFVLVFYLKNKNDEIFKNLKYFLIFISICFLSLILNFNNFSNIQILVALLYLLRFIFYLSIYFLGKLILKTNEKFITIELFVWGLTFVLLGFVQYFFYPNLRNLYYLGWDDHYLRLFSSFLDPDYAGLFIASYLFFILNLFIKSEKFKKIFLGFTFTISFIALLLTYSRGAYLAFFISFIFLIIFSKHKIYKYLFGLFILIFVFFALFFTKGKSEGVRLFRTYSINQRVISLNHALLIFSKNPIFGVGFNTYRYEQEKLGFNLPNINNNHAGAGTDNSFVFILATTGIIGLFVYLFMWSKLLIIKNQNNINSDKYKFILVGIFTIFIGSFFINALFFPPIIVWLWTLTGFIENNLYE